MRENRRAAKERLKSIKTVAELRDYIDSLNLTEDERDIAMMVYQKGWTRQKIAFETGYSVRQVARKIAKINDRI